MQKQEASKIMRKRIPIPPKPASITPPRFNVITLQKIADDMAKGKLKILHNKLDVADEVQPGLKANVYKTGYWSYLVEYKVQGRDGRPHLTIGKHPYMSISEARELAKTIRYLGTKGVDVQDGLIDRLIAELKRDGIQWRGGMAPKP